MSDEAIAVFYLRTLLTKGYAPTFREIATYAHIGLGMVHPRLERLESAGLIPGFRRKSIYRAS